MNPYRSTPHYGSGRMVAEARCPGLELLENHLPNIAEATTIALVGGGPGATKAATGLTQEQIDQKVELMRSRVRSLVLDTTLSNAQSARVARVGRTLERLTVIAAVAVHLDRLSRLLQNDAGREWAGVLLRMARSALLQMGIQTVEAIESRDPADAHAVLRILERVDDSLREAIPSQVTQFMQDPIQRRLSRAALLALYAARDCYGQIAEDFATVPGEDDPANTAVEARATDDLLLPLPPPRARRINF